MGNIPDICWCQKQPTSGEDAGSGGDGKLGGKAGNGSNGANVFLISTEENISKTHYFQIFNTGGAGGVNGNHGTGGKGGIGGIKGHAPSLCKEALPGNNGKDGHTPQDILPRPLEGENGRITLIITP